MSTTLKEKLTAITGAGNVFDDAATLERWSHDQSLVPPCRPNFVARVANAAQVADVVKLANEVRVPVIPYSSGTDFKGGAVPAAGGIVLDMSGLKEIKELDTRLWSVSIGPGVTVRELQEKLAPHGLRVQVPIMTPPNASVLVSYLDREAVPGAGDFIYGNEQIQTFRTVLPTGDFFTIGNPAMPGAPHSGPMGPALNWYRLFMCAQGTMGIVYEMNLRVIPLPKAQKVFLAPFGDLPSAIRALKAVQRQELGYECFVMNSFDLAMLVLQEDAALTTRLVTGDYVGRDGAPPWSDDMRRAFALLLPGLPPWTMVIALSGWARQPEAKVAYQEKDFRALAAATAFEVKPTVGGVMGLDRILADEFVTPWRMQKKFGYRGACHELEFYATGDNLPRVEEALRKVCAAHGYPVAEIGAYVQPVERARSFSCIYDLYGAPVRSDDTAGLRDLYLKASDAMIEAGAFFDRPYGMWADLMYRRNAGYTEYLRKLKKEWDPNNVLNPGKLCF